MLKDTKYVTVSEIKNNEYYLYTKAVVYEKNGYYDLALYNYKLAYGIQEKFILAYEAIIMMYLKGAIRIDNELSVITETLEGIDKNNNRVITAKGLLAMKSRDYISAIELFDSLINQDILSKECIYNNLANAHEHQYDFDNDKQHLFKAEEFYKKAVEINPQYYQAFNNLSLLYLIKFKETQKAKEAIEECLRIFPNYHMTLNTYGLIYEEYKDFDNALQCYFKSYENSKSYSPPINQIGRILDFEYENSLCKNYYELAYQINPNSFVNCFNLGNYYRKYTGNIEEANNYLSTALKQFPTHILCNMSMGLLKYKINDSEIENILQKEIEYNYVNVPEQIYKSLELNAKINIHEAYQYIANNFYKLNP